MKKTIAELIDGLCRRCKLSPKEASAFVQAMFNQIIESLEEDRLVKLRGLGTFKLLSVEERESMNVNTGERIIIPGHDKMTFTPDPILRDEVNKPFADFESVEINADTPMEELMKVPEAEDEPMAEEMKVEEAPTPETVQAEETYAEEPIAAEEVEGTEAPKAEILIDEPKAEVMEEVPTTPAAEEAPQMAALTSADQPKSRRGLWWAVAGLLLALLLGYLIGGSFPLGKLTDAIQPKSDSKTEAVDAQTQADLTSTEATDAQAGPAIDPEAEQKAQELKAAQSLPQVEDGEFLIVGEIGKDTMSIGKNLLRISKRHYGSDKYVPYICAMNHITNPDVVPLNMELVLPKLRRKE